MAGFFNAVILFTEQVYNRALDLMIGLVGAWMAIVREQLPGGLKISVTHQRKFSVHHFSIHDSAAAHLRGIRNFDLFSLSPSCKVVLLQSSRRRTKKNAANLIMMRAGFLLPRF